MNDSVNSMFFARFRISDEDINTLIAEFDNVPAKDRSVVKLSIPVSDILRIGGHGKTIYMGDTPETIGTSIASSIDGAQFDTANRHLYLPVTDVQVDEGDPNYIRFYGAGSPTNNLYIVCKSLTKEVVK